MFYCIKVSKMGEGVCEKFSKFLQSRRGGVIINVIGDWKFWKNAIWPSLSSTVRHKRLRSFSGICRSSLLNQKQCVMVSTKKGRSGHSTCYLHISRNHFNTLLMINLQKNQKFVQNKPLQQRLFDLILGFRNSRRKHGN